MKKSKPVKKNTLKFKRKVPRLTILLFMLIIAAIGSYLVFFSHAATSCSTSNICVIYRKNFAPASDHFLTIDDAEAGNYSLDGPAFYAQDSAANGASKVYRLWNGTLSAHLYTIDPNYKDSLIQPQNGWVDETDARSPAFYAFWNQVAGSSAVYQLVSPDGSDYIYSLDTTEINNLKAAGWSAAPVFWAYYTNPTPAAPTNASPPTGAVSHYGGCDYISGWSADSDNYNIQNKVQIVVDNVVYEYGVTNQAAVINVAGSNHGFWWNLPAAPSSLKAPGTHSVVVWGVDYDTAGNYVGAKNAIIGQGSYTCPSATPPPSSATNNSAPNGYVDQMTCGQISGWAFDPDTNPATSKSNDVHIIIGTETFNLGPTTSARPDINTAYSITGNHGFIFTIPSKYQNIDSPIQVYSIDFDSSGNNVPNSTKTIRILNDTLRCAPKTTTTQAAANTKTAVGTVETADCNIIKGWSYDEDNRGLPTDIHIGINNTPVNNTGPTNLYRKDANDAYGLSGNHGFAFTIPASIKATAKNSYDVKVYAINIDANGAAGGVNTLIWSGKYTCNDAGAKVGTTVSSTTTPAGTENKLASIGKIDANACSKLSGWARDPDTTNPIKIHIYVDGGKPTEFSADQNRGDVGTHAFVADLGATYMDGKRHYADIYGLDYDNAGNYIGLNNALIGTATWSCDSSGKTVTAAGDLLSGKCPSTGPELANGASGDSVAILQNCLKKLGLSISVDGKFGPQTETNLKLFQADYGRALACSLAGSFDYASIVTGKANAQTYNLLAAADGVGWRLKNPNAVSDTRSSCSSTTFAIEPKDTPPAIPSLGAGITGTRTDNTPADPASGLNTPQACSLSVVPVVVKSGQVTLELNSVEKNPTNAESYYSCIAKGAPNQSIYDKFVDDYIQTKKSTPVDVARTINWGNGGLSVKIWELNETKGKDYNQTVKDNEKHDCTLWVHNVYVSATSEFEKTTIGSYSKQECTDIADSIAIGTDSYNTDGSTLYRLTVLINGKRKFVRQFTDTSNEPHIQRPYSITWNDVVVKDLTL